MRLGVHNGTGRGRPGVFRAASVSRSFVGVQALQDVSLEIHSHEVVGLIGPNGAGKSTLVNVMTGFDFPTSGSVTLGDTDITEWAPHRRSRAGLAHEDLGLIDAFDASNNRYRAYADHWQWKIGLHVRDWRYVVRIANISMTDLLAQSSTQANTAATWLPKLMAKALARIPFRSQGRAVFYASRTVKEMLAIGALDKSQQVLAIQPAMQQYGAVTEGFTNTDLTFLGVPIRTVDRILETETALT